MHLWFERVLGNGAYFTVRRDGVFLLNGFGSDPLNYLQVATGIGSGDSVVGLDIPVVRGEPIDVRRVTNQGTLTGPAEFLIVTEEGA